MSGPDPAEYGWWLASRAAGIVALVCIALSVGIGLAMAGRVSRHRLFALHQHTALIGLVAIAVHGITLLGDRFLAPSIGDIALPFTSTFAPLWTGLGVTGGWLAAILGLSYWIRDRIGTGLWRRLHRATILVYVLSVAHAIGAGTDASAPWMQLLLVVTGAPILFLFVLRVLTPAAGPVFRGYRVAEITPESSAVCSFELVPVRRRVSIHAPGQFVTVRSGALVRNYSLSSIAEGKRLRISVKREPGGLMSEHLHGELDVGSTIEVAGPSGAFVLGDHRTRPVVLVSAGIGATPVLAMLQALAAAGSSREVWWVHGARNGREHPFRAEVRQLLAQLPNGFAHVRYSQPDARDVDYDAPGRITPNVLRELPLPADADYRICGPTEFVAALAADIDPARVKSESFGAAAPPPRTPGGSDPLTSGGSDPLTLPAATVGFSRSGVEARWEPGQSLLELAEANGVPAASGCRVGACHGCRAPVLEGSVRHDPEPLAAAPPGSALLCCAVPEGDVLIDA